MSFRCFMLLLVSGLAFAEDSTLPPEATLPDQHFAPVVNNPKKAESFVPGETRLPGHNNPVHLSEFPDESVLPHHTPVQESVFLAAAQPGEFEPATPGDQRPILRLNYPGHTARVRSVTLAAGGDRLVSAGEDKDVHVWQRDPRDPSKWVHARTIRWQVWRGPRGWIYDIAAHDRQLAIAGYGAMGGTGEIWIAGTDDGQQLRCLVDYQSAHRQAVDCVAWNADGQSLVSSDLSGRIVHWNPDSDTGRWIGNTIFKEDTAAHGSDIADRLRMFRGFHPLTWAGDRIVTMQLKQIAGSETPYPIWTVNLRSTQDSTSQGLPGDIAGMISDFQSSVDGNLIVAACHSERSLRLWRSDMGKNSWTTEKLPLAGRPLFVSVNANGTRALVGMEAELGQSQSQVQMIDLTERPAKVIATIRLPETSSAGCFDETAGNVVLAVASRLQTHSVSGDGVLSERPMHVLQTPLAPVSRVAAIAQKDSHEIAISRTTDAAGNKPLTQRFDLSGISLRPFGLIDEADFLPAQRLAQRWTVRPSSKDSNRYELFHDEQSVGQLPLDPTRHGRPTTVSTAKLADASEIVIVGTDGQNGIYLFAADSKSKVASLPIIRQFRGHSGAVRTTSASADGRFLISGGDDALVCVWNLEGSTGAEGSINRWGAKWALDDGGLIVEEIDEAGPLFFRGVRSGDRLDKVSWPDDAGVNQSSSDPISIQKSLAEVSLTTQVVFEFSRTGMAQSTFQMFPAWYPLATLMVDDDREWAIWTPAGIYNASLSGNQRFGWQLNQGLEQDVDFFEADQFRQSLERPEVMRELIRGGSLSAAMRQLMSGSPPPAEASVVNQINSRPSIRIVSPKPNQNIAEARVDVVAEVQTPPGTRLAGVKAFVDGIPGLELDRSEKALTTTVRWHVALPRQEQLRLEVIAASDSGAVERVELDLNQALIEVDRKPQLHVLALGVGKYADANIASLDFPAAATESLTTSFRKYASDLYEVTTQQLVDSEATRPLWRIYATAAIEDLKKRVSPDDIVVMYLCGHGLRDRRTGQWYFATATARHRDLMNDQYEDCLSITDLSLFASLPCRKIAILDSCHSGAIQTSQREDDLKAALRALQDDVVITWTASEGQEEAAEVIEAGLGRFTSRMVEAISGSADSNRDGTVMLDEAVDYVARTVVTDSSSEGMSQHPTAGPPHLIRRIALPISSNAASSSQSLQIITGQ